MLEKEIKTSNKEEAIDEESVVVEHDVSTKADTSNDNIQQDEIPIKIDDDTSVKQIEEIPLNMENYVKDNNDLHMHKLYQTQLLLLL